MTWRRGNRLGSCAMQPKAMAKWPNAGWLMLTASAINKYLVPSMTARHDEDQHVLYRTISSRVHDAATSS